MPCMFCHQPCGDRSFCDEVCYEAYEKAQEEYRAQSECDSLLGNHDDRETNPGFGDKGNI